MSVYFWKMHAIDKLKVQNTLDVIFRININYAELSRLESERLAISTPLRLLEE